MTCAQVWDATKALSHSKPKECRNITKTYSMHIKEPFSKEWERLQEQQILVPQEVVGVGKWCNSFTTVPTPNGAIWLCLNPTRLNQALIWPINIGSTLNYVLPTLINAHFMIISDANSVYDNLKPHIYSHIHVNLAGETSADYNLKQCQQVTCSRGILMKYSKTYQMYLV